jgi:streptogramin lyase
VTSEFVALRAVLAIAVVAALSWMAPPAAAAPTQITEFGQGVVGSPHELVAVPGNGVWFTERGLGAIGHVGPDGEVSSFDEGLAGADATGLIVGPGGDVWFGLKVDSTHSYIGRISAAGTITLYGGLLVGTSPRRLAFGPEGNVWFASTTGTRPSIGFVTPIGAVSQFELPIYPSSLAASPGANIWFTGGEEGGAAIGKVILKEGGGATVTTYSSGLGPKSRPAELIVGPDGDLWFTDSPGEAIGRVTVGGSIEEFPVLDWPQQILAGSEGNLWVRGIYGLSRSTTTGATTYIETPATEYGRNPRDLALGPEGDLWVASEGVTDYFGADGTVGRVTPGGQATDYRTSLPATSQPTEIVAGTGSDLWFADDGTVGAVGRILPGEDPDPTSTSQPSPSRNATSPSAGSVPGSVVLGRHDLRVGHRGYLWIPVACQGGPYCTGELTLVGRLPKDGIRGGSLDPVVARRKYFVPQSGPRSLRVRLSRNGRNLLAVRGHFAVIATFAGQLPTGPQRLGLRLYRAAARG